MLGHRETLLIIVQKRIRGIDDLRITVY
jgi:hypothetical protein